MILLTKLILDERKYNKAISENTVIKNYFSKLLNDKNIKLLAYYLNNEIVGYAGLTAKNTCTFIKRFPDT